MDPNLLEAHLKTIEDQGYCIVENAIEPDLLRRIRDSVARLEDELEVGPRNNPAEGFSTKRMYNLLDKDRVFWELPIHDNALPFAERLLDRECLLSGTTSMNIGPGERLQGLHSEFQNILGQCPYDEVIHRDNLALLD